MLPAEVLRGWRRNEHLTAPDRMFLSSGSAARSAVHCFRSSEGCNSEILNLESVKNYVAFAQNMFDSVDVLRQAQNVSELAVYDFFGLVCKHRYQWPTIGPKRRESPFDCVKKMPCSQIRSKQRS